MLRSEQHIFGIWYPPIGMERVDVRRESACASWSPMSPRTDLTKLKANCIPNEKRTKKPAPAPCANRRTTNNARQLIYLSNCGSTGNKPLIDSHPWCTNGHHRHLLLHISCGWEHPHLCRLQIHPQTLLRRRKYLFRVGILNQVKSVCLHFKIWEV